jgi:hypothetical protein
MAVVVDLSFVKNGRRPRSPQAGSLRYSLKHPRGTTSEATQELLKNNPSALCKPLLDLIGAQVKYTKVISTGLASPNWYLYKEQQGQMVFKG